MSLAQIDDMVPTRTRNVRKIKLRGQVQGVPLLVHNDPKHNFISIKLVRSMGWPLEETTPLKIKLGDEFKVRAQGVWRKLVLDIGNMTSTNDVGLFNLDGIDIVLGTWLASIGGMLVDWAHNELHFSFDSKLVELRGEGSEHKNQLALQIMLETQVVV